MKTTNLRSREELQQEIKRRNKQLIPLNIVVIVLSLVAALTLLFAPLITIDVGQMANVMMETMMSEDSSEENNNNNMFTQVLESLGEVKFSISAMTIMDFAFSEEPMKVVTSMVADKVADVAEDIIANVAVSLIPMMLEGNEIDIDVENINVNEILNKVDGVISAKTETEAKAAISALAGEIQKQAVDSNGDPIIPASEMEKLEEMVLQFYNDAVEALDGEDLTLEAFICVTISKFMNSGNDNEGNAHDVALLAADVSGGSSDKIYTNYEDLINGLLGGTSEGSSEEGSESIADTVASFAPYAQYAAYAMLGFAGVWIILCIFAILHTVSKNKRFVMWYVKLLGFIPCLLFGVLPLVGSALIAGMVGGEAAAMVTGIFGAITTMTWISGGCYVALWLISIFWAFPIKRKIRRAKKELKIVERNAQPA